MSGRHVHGPRILVCRYTGKQDIYVMMTIDLYLQVLQSRYISRYVFKCTKEI